MTKQLLIFFTLSAAVVSVSACTAEQRALDNPPGKYESKTVSTDANGTTRETDSSTDVSVDSHGKKKAVIRSKTTQDPKGLFNKTTISETDKVVEEK